MMGGYGMMAGMGWLGILTMALFWIALLVLIVWGLKGITAQRNDSGPSARGILQQRFARGEISREEFEQARLILREDTRATPVSSR